MLKYQAAAVALKAFSLNPATRRMYRQLGNWRMNRRPNFDRKSYLRNAARLIAQINAHSDGPVRRAADLGTGWAHFYGLSVALATGAEIDLYDVWDNRQQGRLKLAFGDPDEIIAGLGFTDSAQLASARKIAAAETFDELYAALNAQYVLDPAGVLGTLENDVYDAVFSMDVLEHIQANDLPAAIAGQYRALRPGGIAVHEVGVDDHLTHYDRKASLKQYLSYSGTEWRLRFENGVQYFNRTSFDKFRDLFRGAGFEEISASAEQRPDQLAGLRIASEFHNQSTESLEAVRLFLVYRKPHSSTG